MALNLTRIIDGNEAGETIVFVHGWPDDASLWDDTVAAVGATYRCVRVTLPNFGGERAARWGYDTKEIVDALVDLLRDVGAGRPVTLVMHDWGCYWGHAAHHRAPELVARIVGLDVAPHFAPGIGAALGILSYQSWLLAAFAAGGAFGDWMTRRAAKVLGVPKDAERLDAWMNYPYRNFFADTFTGRGRKLTKGYWPTCPILFVYGAKKPFPFHSARWVEHVRKSGGAVVELPCGHWVTRDPSFVDVLSRWLAAPSSFTA